MGKNTEGGLCCPLSRKPLVSASYKTIVPMSLCFLALLLRKSRALA